MTQDLDRAVVHAMGNVAASGQGRGQLIDGLLPLILQKCRLAAEQGIYDLGRMASSIAIRLCALIGNGACHLPRMTQTAISRSRCVSE